MIKKVFAVDIMDDNIYIVWWTYKSGYDEVLFRVSNYAGHTWEIN
jgi:hypothetical protein